MKTIATEEVRSTGGRHSIKIGVVFEDPDTPDYEHAIVWGFEPTLATDSQTPTLEIRTVLHKKYWAELDADLTLPTSDDGSEVVYSGGWMSGPFETTQVPQSVQDTLNAIFGDVLTRNTIEQADEIFDSDLETVPLPVIPDTHSVIVPEFTVKIDGDYTEYLDEDDARVQDGNFTNHMKDAETGEILSTAHPLSHNMSWWFEPKETSDGIRISECFHKTWDDRMHGGFEEKYDRETVVESYRSHTETPPVSQLPKEILTELMQWFGEPFVRSILSETERDLPTYVYECFNCNSVSEVTPRNHCPNCGSDSTCRYESMEQYTEIIEDEDEQTKAVKEMLASSEPTVTMGDE